MRNLPQQMLDNLMPEEWLDYAIKEGTIPDSVDNAIEASIQKQVRAVEEDILADVSEDMVAEYDRGYDLGRSNTIRSIRESLDRC